MSNTNKPSPKKNLNAEELLMSLLSELRRPTNHGLAYIELFLSEIPLPENKQHEFHGDISQQFEEISRLLEEYLQHLKDMPR